MAEIDESSDYSKLPDVVWVRILQYLSLSDRVQVAYTCRSLYEAFNHPTLWSTQTLLFLGNDHNFARKITPVTVAHRYVELTRHFGQYFQNLTVKVTGHFRGLTQDLKEVLEQVTDKCRLEALTLDIGRLTSQFHTRYGFPPDSGAVEFLASFVRNSFRMKHLHIRSWPMFEKSMIKDECNVFKAMISNNKLINNLASLTLFWLDGSDWTEREPLLLEPDETTEIISHFKNLETIGLRSPMVNKELLEMLSSPSRVRLDTLKILVHYLDAQRKPKFRIPSIPARTWQGLVNRNPNFRVEIAVSLNTPDIELSNLLTPEVPVSVFRYMKYSRVDTQTMNKLVTQYSNTLTSFSCYCESDALDKALLLLVELCEHLTYIIYHGNIYTDTVSALAKKKGVAWKVFEMNSRNIKVRTQFDDVDDDSVLHRNDDGELVQVSLLRFHAEEDVEKVKTMISEVSKALGRPWLPSVVN